MKTPIAIYDLDRTLLRHATFTPFLIFAARRNAPWRLALLPVWVGAMAAYKLGLFSRGGLKGFGLRLMPGRLDEARLQRLSSQFAAKVAPSWVGEGAAHALDRDRAEGRIMILATAAMQFYAYDVASRLGFDHILATGHALAGSGHVRLAGENCYGAEKVPRVEALLSSLSLDRADCDIRFYTDSASDAPLLDWADEGVLVDARSKGRALAARRGWQTASFAQG